MAIAQLIEQTIAQHILQPKVLSYIPSKLDEVQGRFVASNRVYNFLINKDGVSYSPAGQSDSLLFSALYLRQDAARKPKIGNDKCNAGKSYQCGKICLGNRRKCHKGVRDVNDARRIASILASTNQKLAGDVSGKISEKAFNKGSNLFAARAKREREGKLERIPKGKSIADIPNIPESAKPWVKSVERLVTPELVAIAKKLGFPEVTTDATDTGTAFCNLGTGTVGMSSHDLKDLHAKVVFLHEYGHFLDTKLNKNPDLLFFSSSPEGIAARKKDEQILLKAQKESDEPSRLNEQLQRLKDGTISKASIKKVLKPVRELLENAKMTQGVTTKLQKDHFESAKRDLTRLVDMGGDMDSGFYNLFRNTLRYVEYFTDLKLSPTIEAHRLDDSTKYKVYDLFGAITKNKVGFGHSDSYYSDNEKTSNHFQGGEAFANVIAIANSGDEKAIAVAKKYAPNMWKFTMNAIKVNKRKPKE